MAGHGCRRTDGAWRGSEVAGHGFHSTDNPCGGRGWQGRGGDHNWRGVGAVARTGRGGGWKWRGMCFAALPIYAGRGDRGAWRRSEVAGHGFRITENPCGREGRRRGVVGSKRHASVSRTFHVGGRGGRGHAWLSLMSNPWGERGA